MIVDIHTHLVNPDFNKDNCKKNFAIEMFLKKVNYTNFDNYVSNLLNQIRTSKLDKIVVSAIENSEICANNKQVVKLCNDHKEFLYGANLNPFDSDIEEKLKVAIEHKVILIKILPSYQNIDLSDEKCIPFFEMLKEYNLPMLVHTGKEYTLKNKKDNQKLNNPKLLENAAQTGVKIICAHCGTRIFLHEKDYFKEWVKLARKYENVYGDLSAMITPVQFFDLKYVLKNKELKNKVLFGTDYPGFPCEFMVKPTSNVFCDTYNYLEKIGFDDKMFNNTERLLNL